MLRDVFHTAPMVMGGGGGLDKNGALKRSLLMYSIQHTSVLLQRSPQKEKDELTLRLSILTDPPDPPKPNKSHKALALVPRSCTLRPGSKQGPEN